METVVDLGQDLNIVAFGAVPGTAEPCTDAITEAITVARRNGGGRVVVPAGTFRTGPIQLDSHVHLHLGPGAILSFVDEYDSYPLVQTRWAGFACWALSPCILAEGCENVAITGQGVIDGNGHAWWQEYRRIVKAGRRTPTFAFEQELHERNREVITTGTRWNEWACQFLRPPLIQFNRCRRVTMRDVTLRNSPFWNTHILFSHDVQISGVRFENPQEPKAFNGDGLDIDSSSNVRVSDCTFDVSDDCIVLKAGIGEDGLRIGQPTEDVTITNCTMLNGHGGLVVGSDTAGGIRQVAMSNCVMRNVLRGIRFKSRRGRGGGAEDITIHGVTMNRVLCPLILNLYYSAGTADDWRRIAGSPEKLPVDALTPRFCRIQVSNVIASNVVAAAGVLIGLPESPLRDIRLADLDIAMDERAREPGYAADTFDAVPELGRGMRIEHARGMSLRHVSVRHCRGPAITFKHCHDLRQTEMDTTC